jgi:hypothetical protein
MLATNRGRQLGVVGAGKTRASDGSTGGRAQRRWQRIQARVSIEWSFDLVSTRLRTITSDGRGRTTRSGPMKRVKFRLIRNE